MTLYLIGIIIMGMIVYGFIALLVINYFWRKYSNNKAYHGYHGLIGVFFYMQTILFIILILLLLSFTGWSWKIVLFLAVSCGMGYIGYYISKIGKKLEFAFYIIDGANKNKDDEVIIEIDDTGEEK